MENNIKKYCDIVRNSSNENEKAIKLLYESKLYKKVVGTNYYQTFFKIFNGKIRRIKD